MEVLLWILAGFALLLLAVLGVVLATPLALVGRATLGPRPAVAVQLRLLGGRAPPIPISAGRTPGAKPKSTRKKRRKRDSGGWFRGRAPLRALPRLLADWLHVIRIGHLRVDADFGLGDPAETGSLYGLLCPLIYALPPDNKVSLDLRPDFTARRLDGEVEGALTLRPAALLPPLAGFGWRLLRGAE